mgnify:CR=1 FL=1
MNAVQLKILKSTMFYDLTCTKYYRLIVNMTEAINKTIIVKYEVEYLTNDNRFRSVYLDSDVNPLKQLKEADYGVDYDAKCILGVTKIERVYEVEYLTNGQKQSIKRLS